MGVLLAIAEKYEWKYVMTTQSLFEGYALIVPECFKSQQGVTEQLRKGLKKVLHSKACESTYVSVLCMKGRSWKSIPNKTIVQDYFTMNNNMFLPNNNYLTLLLISFMNALLKCQQYIDTIGFQKTFGSFIPSAYPHPESTYFLLKKGQ